MVPYREGRSAAGSVFDPQLKLTREKELRVYGQLGFRTVKTEGLEI